MLSRQFCDFGFPGQRGTDARNFVCRDLFAVSRATQDDAKGARFARDCFGSAQAEDRIIIERFIFERTMVDHFVTIEVKVANDEGLICESGVIAGDMDFHGGILSEKSEGAVHFLMHARLHSSREGMYEVMQPSLL